MTRVGNLTQEEVEFYRKNGYLLYKKPLLSSESFAKLGDIFEEHLANKGNKRGDELDYSHYQDPRLLDILLSDEVLDLVEPITGPNIGLWSSAFLSKEPYVGRGTPWHEDSAYWKGLLDNYDNIVTIWLAIDRSSKENGCMRVIAGSHVNGFSDYEEVDSTTNTFSSQIKNIDDSNAVYFELEKNECSLHDSRIIHGALPNKSPFRRCGYTMRYFPTSTKVNFERIKNVDFKIWLARGKDLSGNRYVNQN